MKEPLGRVVGVGLGQAIGVLFLGGFGPVGEVEGNFDQGGVGDIELLVNASHCIIVFR